MATPHVAGVAALLWAAGAKTPDQVEKAMFLSAKPPQGAAGWTEQFGHGVVDAEGALKALNKVRAAEGVRELLPPEVQAAQEHHEAIDALTTASGEVTVFAFSPIEWQALALASAMLAFVLLTLSRKERPGYLNVLFTPGFVVPLLLTTMGAFFVQYLAAPSAVTTLVTLPIPDWLNRIIFGRGALANPIIYSAAIPIVLSLVAISLKSIRNVVGGVAIGFAGILAYAAWSHAPALAWLPFTFLAMPWLVVNALICLFIARAMIRKEAP
jgi:serine protease